MSPEGLDSFARNDPVYLAGVHTRLRQSVRSYKLGQRDLSSLWGGSVTDVSDIFANLGRAAAHLPFAENEEEALGRLVDPSSEAACWRSVVERLVHELRALGAKNYSEWETEPFRGLEEVIALGFEAVGLFPTHNGKNLHVRVH